MLLFILAPFLPLVLSFSWVDFNIPITRETKIKLNYPKETYYNFTEIANLYNYTAEEHIVTTDDGFILTIFRMKNPNCTSHRSVPVILMHGICLNSNVWLIAGPEVALGYFLADSCYDVWFGNVRGNNYGRAHVSLNPDTDSLFWKHSTDEMGYYDVPATIDYVTDVTRSDKVNYIGHSQGGAAFLIGLAQRPEYNSKVGIYIGLAPAARVPNSKSTLLKLLGILGKWLLKFGVLEVFSDNSLLQVLIEYICKDIENRREICLSVLTAVDNYHPGSISNRTLQVLYGGFPKGVSMQTVVKFLQAFETGKVARYDYGTIENLKIYGKESPPDLNITNVEVPAVLFAGQGDNVIVTDDVQWTAERLPNLLEMVVVSGVYWNHFDDVYSQYLPKLLYPKLNKYLSDYSD